VPRLRQVRKGESEAPIVATMYDFLFQGRDPVAEPGTFTGAPGDWWTVFALVPDVLEHAVQGFALYQSPNRQLDPVLRELAQIRAGWAAGSQFVYSQHAKSLRDLGVDEEKIGSIPAWAAARCYSDAERAVLAYADCLVYDRGRVPDELFDVLQRHLPDEQILELTYITCLYSQHAVMSRALRTEFDDRNEPVVEVPGPPGATAMHPGR
jgi:alkylhydroperoxidase family enzyme